MLRWIMLIAALGVTTALPGCKRSVSWHQKLTLVIGTPAGEVSGSSVTRIENISSKGALVLPEARGTRSSWTGEAVAVEVLPGKWLFALLEGEGYPSGEGRGGISRDCRAPWRSSREGFQRRMG